MARRNFYANKYSEYRQNYLPFDYYDFWITAKENENLRFKNKLRDYLHTPFDWDEGLELHLEQQQDERMQRANQATQTSDRPNRHDQMKKLTTSKNNNAFTEIDENQLHKRPKTPTKANEKAHHKPTKSACVQVNIQSSTKQPRTAHKQRPSRSAKVNRTRKPDPNMNENNNQLLNQYKLARSMTNIAIQTPFEWKLRDYSKQREPSRSASSIHRSASVASLQPKRPPFANYGWAVQTKDLSKKPTRNALANKVLARKYHDESAMSELKLQQLKKEATALANEQCALESKSLDRFHSDSREWLSEYENKFTDHSKSAHKNDLYHSLNANKLKKSSLVVDERNYQSLRAPKSGKNKIYYWE